MQVLVTGGLGFVGSNLVDTLVDMGHKVKALQIKVQDILLMI